MCHDESKQLSSGPKTRERSGASMTTKELDAFRLSRIYREGWNAAKKQIAAGLVDADESSVSALNPHRTKTERARWAEGFDEALGGRHSQQKTTAAKHWRPQKSRTTSR